MADFSLSLASESEVSVRLSEEDADFSGSIPASACTGTCIFTSDLLSLPVPRAPAKTFSGLLTFRLFFSVGCLPSPRGVGTWTGFSFSSLETDSSDPSPEWSLSASLLFSGVSVSSFFDFAAASFTVSASFDSFALPELPP